MRLPLNDEHLIDLLAWWGTPYSYGAGKPSDELTSWPPSLPPVGMGRGRGVDCSGFVQIALVRLGLLSPDAPDRSAAALYDLATLVALGDERMGDLAFYGLPGHVGHVMLVVGAGVVLGARGGDATTNADNPRAYVSLEPLKYWVLFMGVRRLPAKIGV